MWVTQIFLLCFRNSFFSLFTDFWFRGSSFEWDLNRACESRWCLRAVAGHEVWHWAARFETFTERNCWVWWVCLVGFWAEVVLLSPSFRGGVWGVKYCWNGCSSNFSVWNKFIIVLPCGLLLDNNIFSKMCSEELMLVILNSTLLHNQSD